ncbi:hypothetical protein LRC484719_38370 [Mycobacterium riyadhense]
MFDQRVGDAAHARPEIEHRAVGSEQVPDYVDLTRGGLSTQNLEHTAVVCQQSGIGYHIAMGHNTSSYLQNSRPYLASSLLTPSTPTMRAGWSDAGGDQASLSESPPVSLVTVVG